MDTANREQKRKAKLKPAIVALYKTTTKLDNLDQRLFALPLAARLAAHLAARLNLRSHEQTA